ncbi:MAG: RdgB/HAM1 family non-canonical purine NTP pyrophosphatase [Acidimicrobiia bacterium]|nr:MAG: RdgB/HAM1 family non-canonical purine NTP pyrophosphatase [Acidimicrobiia bacterium]
MKTPRRVVVASKNPDKIREVEAVLRTLDPPIEIVHDLDWLDIEETEDTLEGNAVLKAISVAEATGIAAIADDTGLEVDALDGGPGVHTARYAGADATYESNLAKLLSDLGGVEDRGARFRTVIALVVPGADPILTEGVMEGQIAHRPRGTNGFGYDPVFLVGDRTYAEMSDEEKNAISHRGLALRALADALAAPH